GPAGTAPPSLSTPARDVTAWPSTLFTRARNGTPAAMPVQLGRPSGTTNRLSQTTKPGKVRPTQASDPATAAAESATVASESTRNRTASARRGNRLIMRAALRPAGVGGGTS